MAEESAESDFEAQLTALAFIDNLAKEREILVKARQSNLPKNIPAKRLDFQKTGKSALKSDVKKSSAFVKKLRATNNEGLQQCIRDTDTLNLALYISEIVAAILSITFKATECSTMVKLCLSFHQKYEDFTEPLVNGLKSALFAGEDGDPEAGKKRRIMIRFAVELYQVGIFNDDDFFVQLLRLLLGKVKPQNPNAKAVADLQGLTVFVKYGNETLLGFLPKAVLDLAAKAGKKPEEVAVKLLVSPKNANEMRMLIKETYDKLCEHLVKAHQEFRTKESKYEKDKLIYGTVSEAKQTEFDSAKKLYEKLLSVVASLSEGIHEAVPELIVEKEEEEAGPGITVWDSSVLNPQAQDAEAASGGAYGDVETRSFYEDLPDLLEQVPLSVLGLTHEQAEALLAEWAAAKESTPQEALQMEESMESSAASEEAGEADVVDDEAESAENTAASASATLTEEDASDSRAHKLNTLLNEKLFECVNKQKADEFCVSFCYLQNKNARRRLSQAMLRLPRSRGELAPFFARIIATLHRLFPDILPPILDAQRKEFFGILKFRKTATHIESKLRNVRYQGELVKFKLAPPIVAFRLFKALFDDFLNPQSLEMLAVLLETCGRYLYLTPYTHKTMAETLETMMRLRRARNIDVHHQTMLESAYFAVKPPEKSLLRGKKEKTLSLAQQYVRFLLSTRLQDKNVAIDDVIKSLRRLPWTDANENIAYHVVKASLKLAKTKYTAIPALADCLSGLQQYRPCVVETIVDRAYEEVQRSLESTFKRDAQRVHGFAKLLGELYNFTALSTQVIFDLLYHIINYGHDVKKALDAERDREFKEKESNKESKEKTEREKDRESALSAVAAIAASLPPSVYPPVYQLAAVNPLFYDPRVPCETDTPYDLFRAQIVCEILNTCGMYYVKGASKEKLSRFLVYFQRYLLTKQMIPVHVEFTILDTLDTLEEMAREATLQAKTSHKHSRREKERDLNAISAAVEFARFDSFEAAQRVVETMEGGERAKLQGLSAVSASANTAAMNEAEREREESESEEDADSEDESESDGSDDDSEDDDDDSSDDDDDDEDNDEDNEENEEEDVDDLASDDLSESEATKMLEKMRIAEEDEEFERAFKSVVQESISTATAKNQDMNRMALPAILPKPKNTVRMEDDSHEDKPKSTMSFKLLSRDTKGRIEARQLLVPQSNPMAQKVMKAEEEMRLEKQRLKERTLQINQLIVDEEEELDAAALAAHSRYGKEYQPATVLSSQPSRSGKQTRGGGAKYVPAMRAEETRRPVDSLNLDEFLAETNAADMRRVGSSKRN